MPRHRIGVGCQACRIRHTKCDESISSCNSCRLAGIDCVRSLKLRFRNGLGAASTSLFDDDQPWTGTSSNLKFHDETLEVIKHYKGSSHFASATCSAQPSRGPAASCEAELVRAPAVLEEQATTCAQDLRVPSLGPRPRAILFGSESVPSQPCVGLSRPANVRLESHRNVDGTAGPHAAHGPAASAPLPNTASALPFTEREAALIRHFIESMACWADITDLKRTFEIDVPRLALYHPVLRYAVLAFSCRHINKDASGDSPEALEYYDRCLQLLISIIPGDHISEVVFAACGILRQYEEQDLDDNLLHLKGATRMLNSMSPSDFLGGLGEAAAWLCLRQDIAVALALHRPLCTNLDNFMLSDIFQRDDDVAWASRMIFLLARVLRSHGAPMGQPAAATEQLSAISKEVEDWHNTKPPTFDPIRHTHPGERGLPQIWMLAPFHAVGLQYWYIAKILLELFPSHTASRGYDSLHETRRIEGNVRTYLLCVLGLAESNPNAENLLFSARHALAAWGGVFRDTREHEAVEKFLDHVQRRTGWNMSRLRSTLHAQWRDDG